MKTPVRIFLVIMCAILIAITSDDAPNAAPVTGPTTKVATPPPIVTRSTGERYPRAYATITPAIHEVNKPIRRETTPTAPTFLISRKSAPKAVETIAKSRNMAPPIIPIPAKNGIDAKPFEPPPR